MKTKCSPPVFSMRTEGNHQGIKNMSLIRLNVYPREKQKKKKKIIDNSQENIKILAFGNSYLYSNWNLNKYDINIFNFLLLQVFFVSRLIRPSHPGSWYILTFLYFCWLKIVNFYRTIEWIVGLSKMYF